MSIFLFTFSMKSIYVYLLALCILTFVLHYRIELFSFKKFGRKIVNDVKNANKEQVDITQAKNTIANSANEQEQKILQDLSKFSLEWNKIAYKDRQEELKQAINDAKEKAEQIGETIAKDVTNAAKKAIDFSKLFRKF